MTLYNFVIWIIIGSVNSFALVENVDKKAFRLIGGEAIDMFALSAGLNVQSWWLFVVNLK